MVSKLTDIETRVVGLIRRWWRLLCVLPLCLTALYQVNKVSLPWQFDSRLSMPATVDTLSLCIMALAAVVSIALIYRKPTSLSWMFGTAATVTLVGSLAVLSQKDPAIEWNDDVPLGYFSAARYGVENGLLEPVSTWNAQGNPYVTRGGRPTQLPHPEEFTANFDASGLRWISGSNWDDLDFPQGSNRMLMHPPLYSVALAVWMKVWGVNHTIAQVWGFLLKVIVVGLALFWVRRIPGITTGYTYVALGLLIGTAPPILLNYKPHANELGTVLSMAAVMLVFPSKRIGFRRMAAAGALLCAAFYVNFFFCLPFLGLAAVGIADRRATGTWHAMLGVIAGASTVVVCMTAAGYYPWLTYLTGAHLTKYYRIDRPVDLASGFIDFMYLGLPLLFCLAVGVLRRTGGSIQDRYAEYGLLLATVLSAWLSFGLIGSHRYMIGVVLLLIPSIVQGVRTLVDSSSSASFIPVYNVIFVSLVLYL